jgi:hypothetical protein
LPVVLCGCETWPLAIREEHRPRVFENKALKKIFELRKGRENFIMRSFMICTLHQVYLE